MLWFPPFVDGDATSIRASSSRRISQLTSQVLVFITRPGCQIIKGRGWGGVDIKAKGCCECFFLERHTSAVTIFVINERAGFKCFAVSWNWLVGFHLSDIVSDNKDWSFLFPAPHEYSCVSSLLLSFFYFPLNLSCTCYFPTWILISILFICIVKTVLWKMSCANTKDIVFGNLARIRFFSK